MLYYLPLESYEERYTYQLTDWTVQRLRKRGVQATLVEGKRLPASDVIQTGVALDAHGRSYYALTQTAEMVSLLRERKFSPLDAIYMQDMFHPGYEALPYILAQVPVTNRPRIYTHNLAQSIDVYDFTFPMRHWMRHYEHLVDLTVDGVFVASEVQVELSRMALLDNAPIYKVGLAFDVDEVRSRVPSRKPLLERSERIVYASRFDTEKQPQFWMGMVETIKRDPSHPLHDYEFAILTGAPQLRSNDPDYVETARAMAAEGLLVIYEGLKKNEYYRLLADSRVQVNTAKQDFVSNTLNEASALGTPTLAPGFRSFPEALFNSGRQLYTPWNMQEAINKLTDLVDQPPAPAVIERPALYHHQALDKAIDVMLGGS